jgi:hypothetical protein
MYGEVDLARDFRAIEIIGYASTAIRAGLLAPIVGKMAFGLDAEQTAILQKVLKELHDEVLPNSFEQLRQFDDLVVPRAYLKGEI